MSDENIEKAGRYQTKVYLENTSQDLMLQDFAPTTEEEAYSVQRHFIRQLSEARGSVGGYKIAYTSAVMREARGVSAPCSGLMFASKIVNSPTELNISDYTKLAVECEVAVRLGTEVSAEGAPYTRESIAPHISALLTAFEIIDIRPAEAPDDADPAISSIATNISNEGAVLGRAVENWQEIELATARGTMSLNGDQVGEGLGSDVMGHPLEALVWLANSLATRGESIFANAIVITGSIIPPTPLNLGDIATISIEGLGDAQIIVGGD